MKKFASNLLVLNILGHMDIICLFKKLTQSWINSDGATDCKVRSFDKYSRPLWLPQLRRPYDGSNDMYLMVISDRFLYSCKSENASIMYLRHH